MLAYISFKLVKPSHGVKLSFSCLCSKTMTEKYSTTWLSLLPKAYDTGEAYSFDDSIKLNVFPPLKQQYKRCTFISLPLQMQPLLPVWIF